MPSRLFCIRIFYWAQHPTREGFEIAMYVLFNAIHQQSWRSSTIARTHIRPHLGPLPVYDEQDNCIIQGESIASGGNISQDGHKGNTMQDAQDGQGDPNLSAICPPLPNCIVEPKLQGHETGFHIITSGTTVGILSFMCIFFWEGHSPHLLSTYSVELQNHTSTAPTRLWPHFPAGIWWRHTIMEVFTLPGLIHMESMDSTPPIP